MFHPLRVIPGNDYVADPEADLIVKEASPRFDVVHEDDEADYDYNTAPPPLEYHEYKITATEVILKNIY